MKKTKWVIGIYNKQFEFIKPLKTIVGTYEQADKACEVLQTRHSKLIIMFDYA